MKDFDRKVVLVSIYCFCAFLPLIDFSLFWAGLIFSLTIAFAMFVAAFCFKDDEAAEMCLAVLKAAQYGFFTYAGIGIICLLFLTSPH